MLKPDDVVTDIDYDEELAVVDLPNPLRPRRLDS
jgi:hypothetical protein